MSQVYNTRISLSKAKVTQFRGCYPVRMKVMGDDCTVASRYGIYGIWDVTFRGAQTEMWGTNRVNLDGSVGGSKIKKTLRSKVRPKTKIKFYEVLLVPTLLCGAESWTCLLYTSRCV